MRPRRDALNDLDQRQQTCEAKPRSDRPSDC